MFKSKKQNYFKENNLSINYKSVDLLQKFTNPNGRIMNHKKTHLSAKHQRALATAIKRARFMGLMPFIAK